MALLCFASDRKRRSAVRVPEPWAQPDVSCSRDAAAPRPQAILEAIMNGIIYLIGLIVVIMAILSLFGLR